MKTIITSFSQNTAEFYDNHISWAEFGLKPCYFALHLMEKQNFFKTMFPPLGMRSY